MARQTQKTKQHKVSYLSPKKKNLSRGRGLGEGKTEPNKQDFSVACKHSLLAIAVASLMYQNGVMANPTSGKVVAGSAQITQKSPSKLHIIQKSHKAVIDWRGFSIAKGEHTRFLQPSSSAIALNRVRGKQASLINGTLTANGNVWLINPNGVLFGKGTQINVRGLIATTSDINNDDFIAGRYLFNKPTDNIHATIVNQGQIEVTDGGSIVLAANKVSNEGSIKAKLGHVVLASGDTFTMDFYGDGLLQFDIGDPVQQSGNGDTEALVSNPGKITVDGGIVEMTAKTRNTMVERVINMEGVIQAWAVDVEGGTIILSGGKKGIVAVSGTLDVSGIEQGQVGGVAKVLGEKVGLFDGAKIDASGEAGGGEVLVGGNFQGKGSEQNARRTLITDDVTIKAGASDNGDGGRVIVWSDEVTEFQGSIDVSAGKNAGDGGFVEVSGKKSLGFHGVANVSAENGKDGSILLDPENIRIVETGGQNNNEISDGEWLFQDGPTSGDSTVDATAVEALSGDIIFQATQDINIDAALDLQNQEKGERVVFQAGNDININANIQSSGNGLGTLPGPQLYIEADSPFASNSNIADGQGAVFISDVRINGFEKTFFIGADFKINSSARIKSFSGNSIGPSENIEVIIGTGILNETELNVFNMSDVESFRVWAYPYLGENGRSNVNRQPIPSLIIDEPISLTNSLGGAFFANDIDFKKKIEAPDLIRALSYGKIDFSEGVTLNSKTIRLERYSGTIGIGVANVTGDVKFTPDILSRLEAETLILNGPAGVTINGLTKENLAPKVTGLRLVGYVPTNPPSPAGTIEFKTAPTNLSGINLLVETNGNIEVNTPLRADNIDFTSDELSLNASVSSPGGQFKIQNAAVSDRRLRSNQTPNIIIGNTSSNLQGLILTTEDLDNIGDGFSRIWFNSLKLSENESTIVIGDAEFPHSVQFSMGPKGSIILDGRLTANGSINFDGTRKGTDSTDITLAGSIVTPSKPITINQNAVLGGNLEINTTLRNTQGASLDFQNTLNGSFDLTLDSGDIRFSKDVGTQDALANVTITRANNVTIDGRFIAGDTRIQHSGDFTTGPDGFLNVNNLYITPGAKNSASLNGKVAGAEEKQTATKVEGPQGDPKFTINGCNIGVECVKHPEPSPDFDIKEDIPVEAEPRAVVSVPTYNTPPDEVASYDDSVVNPNQSDTSNYLFNDESETDNQLAANTDESESGGESEVDDESDGESESEEEEEATTSSSPPPLVPVVMQIRRPSYNPKTYQYSNFGNTELWEAPQGAYSISSFPSAVFSSQASKTKLVEVDNKQGGQP